MELKLSDFSEEKQDLEARIDALEILAIGLYGILAKHAAVDPEVFIDELAKAERSMRQKNAHSEILRVLRSTREHVSDEAYGPRGGR